MSQIEVSDQPDKFPYEISVHAKKRIDERNILLTWIEETIEKPDKTEPHQTDPELEIAFKKIESCGERVLKVVYNTTVSPFKIVTTHFDRSKKGKL
jgi:hypothetical protein